MNNFNFKKVSDHEINGVKMYNVNRDIIFRIKGDVEYRVNYILSKKTKTKNIVFMNLLKEQISKKPKFQSLNTKFYSSTVIRNAIDLHIGGLSKKQKDRLWELQYVHIGGGSKFSGEVLDLIVDLIINNDFDLHQLLFSKIDNSQLHESKLFKNTIPYFTKTGSHRQGNDFTRKTKTINNTRNKYNIDDFIFFLQEEINKRVQKKYPGISKGELIKYLISKEVLHSVFLKKNSTQVYSQMFSNLPEKIRRLPYWQRMLAVIDIRELNNITEKYIKKQA